MTTAAAVLPVLSACPATYNSYTMPSGSAAGQPASATGESAPPAPPGPAIVTTTGSATELAQVTRSTINSNLLPVVTPDGQHLVYNLADGIVIANLDSLLRGEDPPAGLKTLIMTSAFQGIGLSPMSLRPDGSLLGVWSGPGPGETSLVRLDPPGMQKVLFTERPPAPGQAPAALSYPSATSDGAWIAYAAGNGGFGYARSDGSDQVVVASSGFDFPVISPDGTRFAYGTRDGAGYVHVAIQPIGLGTETAVRGAEQAQAGQFSETMPAWSPDGRYVVYASDFGVGADTNTMVDGTSANGQDLWVFDTATGTSTQLTTGSARSDSPRWGTDGYIYFSSDSGNAYASGGNDKFFVWRLRPVLP
jgi:Tol biopolymer transport system component